MFSSNKYNPTKLKVNLKLAITRVQMLQKKKENQGLLSKKEVAKLLEKEKPELARIRTEQIIRDDYMIETLEIMEVYFNLLVSRAGLLDSVKVCDPGIREAVCTIIWAAPYLQAEVTEMKMISASLCSRFGKEFAQDALENRDKGDGSGIGWVSERIMRKLQVTTPSSAIVTGYLQAIAKTYGITYTFLEPLPQDMRGGGFSADMFPDAPDKDLGGLVLPPDTGFYVPGQNNNNGGHGGPGGNMPNIDNMFPSPGNSLQPGQQQQFAQFQQMQQQQQQQQEQFRQWQQQQAQQQQKQQQPLPTYPPDYKTGGYPQNNNTPQQPMPASAPLDPLQAPGLFPPAPTGQQPLPVYPADNKGPPMNEQTYDNAHGRIDDGSTMPVGLDYADPRQSYTNDGSDNLYEEVRPQEPSTDDTYPPQVGGDDFPMPPSHSSSSLPGIDGMGGMDGGNNGAVGQESEVPDFDDLLSRFHQLKTDGEE